MNLVGEARLRLKMEYLLDKYRKHKLDVINMLKYGYPFVLRHRNIIDYIDGVNPELSNNINEIKYAVRLWKKILSYIVSFSTLDRLPNNTDFYVLGILHPGTYIISSEIPRPPHVPKYFGYIHENDIAIIERNMMKNPRGVYIYILRNLSKAVIVKSSGF